jgi:ferrous iron transport protein B
MSVKKVALLGNPNAGKTSIFNQLTGLNQQIGNYPGITVDKKTGTLKLANGESVEVLDLPGTYSVYPKSEDERIVFDILSDTKHPDHPDLAIVVADASNLERNLFLFTQVNDMNIPAFLVLNMIDVSKREGIKIDTSKLSELLGNTTIVEANARKGEGINELIEKVASYQPNGQHPALLPEEFQQPESSVLSRVALPELEKQTSWAEKRYQKIRQLLSFCQENSAPEHSSSRKITNRIDKVVTHPIAGYLIFLAILTLIFQAIFAWAEWPMNLIDTVFLSLSQITQNVLPEGVFTNLLAEGIIPGLGGIVIFIPQIALLFAFIFILEESGYMARVVFIMDRLMRPFGLNGKSVVPLISGVACAIPAIMATRNIDNSKDRLLTILVTPLMSCSARLPVYTLLIALVIPNERIWGIFNYQGLALLSMYLIGLLAALGSALLFRFFIRVKQKSFLVMELPLYKTPRWNNVFITLWEKTRVFIWEAGKVIMAISIILWVLASYGPEDRINEAVNAITTPEQSGKTIAEYEIEVSSVKLENSYIGILGKQLEPAIRPLGYNWQIGIALITSFAAREVFVGSMATIYSVGEDFEEGESLLKRMATDVNPATGEKVYNLASGLSLMVFYAFAMQCMSTLAIVYRETKSWKWPLFQTVYMTALAYFASLIIYQLLK